MKKIWHYKAHKEYGSDSNVFRRLYEDMKLEDGYNDQVGKLMFRCADEMDRLKAENEKLVANLYKIAELAGKPVYKQEQRQNRCVWIWSAMGCWHSACQTAIIPTLDPAPATCPYCDRAVVVVSWQAAEEDK